MDMGAWGSPGSPIMLDCKPTELHDVMWVSPEIMQATRPTQSLLFRKQVGALAANMQRSVEKMPHRTLTLTV